MKVWKYTLPIDDAVNEIEMPKDAEILTVQMQDNILAMWALVDTAAENETRHFCVIGTGWEDVSAGAKYHGTVQVGGFVWHVFEPSDNT